MVPPLLRHGERSAAIHDPESGLLDCRASLAETKGRHGERSAAIHDPESGLLDCRASLAETKGCHGERSAAIHCSVMASAARPSMTPNLDS